MAGNVASHLRRLQRQQQLQRQHAGQLLPVRAKSLLSLMYLEQGSEHKKEWVDGDKCPGEALEGLRVNKF